MKTTVYSTSKNLNNYYLDIHKNIVGYAHPLLAWVNQFESQNGTFDQIPESINIEGVSQFTKKEIQYYYGKYKFLKDFGLNSEKVRVNDFYTPLAPDLIEYKIANLNQLTLEVTDACNLNCNYCGYSEFYYTHDKRENKIMPFEVAKRIIDYLVEKWNSSLNSSYKGICYISFYGGEPLLCIPLIKKIINYVNSLYINREIIFSMTTNAVLLDKYEDFLVENKIRILISLDGNEYNNSYRVDHSGKSSFVRIYRNVKHIAEKHPVYFENCVNFNSVLHNRNSVEEIHNFIKKEFNKIETISPLNDFGIQKNKLDEFKKMYKNYLTDLNQSKHSKEIIADLFIKAPQTHDLILFMTLFSGTIYRSYSDFFTDDEKRAKLLTGTCIPFGKKMFVTVNGKILPCEKISQEFGLGQVNEKNIYIDPIKIADKYNSYFQKMVKQCSYCYQAKSCSQCLFNIHDLHDNNPTCFGFENYSMFAKYLSSTISYLEDHPELYKTILRETIME